MGLNISTNIWEHLFWKKVFCINLLVVTHHNKMVLLKEKIGIYLKLFGYLCFPWMFLIIFGGNALLTSCYLTNKMSSWVLKFQTPLQVLKNYFFTSKIIRDPPLKVFGCVCYVYVPNVFRSKLNSKTDKCVFIVYTSSSKFWEHGCQVCRGLLFFFQKKKKFFRGKTYLMKILFGKLYLFFN